ncbi:helix-turn-helix transcriptional regulator [Aliarcobacter butzleri]|uniref:helix-turn-helix transcriptional regulator n=1 Tax=Aliarcobacter butzleri TaxID=28197 RepID=UPI00125F9D78|nr:hypothetical protein [Aliarcobacter butzleri]
MNNEHVNDKFLKIDDVLIIIPISKASLYRLAKKVNLLRPIKIGGSSFWSQNNINKYFENLKNEILNYDKKD